VFRSSFEAQNGSGSTRDAKHHQYASDEIHGLILPRYQKLELAGLCRLNGMKTRSAKTLLVGAFAVLVFAGCSDSVSSDSTEISVDSTTVVSDELTQIRDKVSAVLLPYVANMVNQFPKVTSNIQSVKDLVLCMTDAGIAMNGINETTSSTVAPIESLINPMMEYLLIQCSGVQQTDWMGS
jgi:hypothetical protein